MRTAIGGGWTRAFLSALGITAGCFIWGLASALGLTALLAASSVLYDGLRIAGALYLCWLGVQALRSARKPLPEITDGGEVPPSVSAAQSFSSGFLTNLLNPKVGVFYLSLLPNFVPADSAVLPMTMLLVGIHAVLGIVWLSLVAALVELAKATLTRRRVRKAFEQATGVALIGFGVGVGVETAIGG
ncbi:LysE family translocator [Saccharothrix sp. 6-C]|nr:LysE family translocator [Saccharothrix sp. 6-C]